MFIRPNALSLLFAKHRRALAWQCRRPLTKQFSYTATAATNASSSQNTTHAGSAAAGTHRAPIALVFDTETTGMVDSAKPSSDPSQPHVVQLGMILVDTGNWKRRLMQCSFLVQLSGPNAIMNERAQQVHGISADDCAQFGIPPALAAQIFWDTAQRADILVAHNLPFDAKVMEAAMHRHLGVTANYSLSDSTLVIPPQPQQQRLCTMRLSTPILKLPPNRPGRRGYKYPSLQETYSYFFAGEETHDSGKLENAHDALADAEACLAVFQRLVESGQVQLDNILPNASAPLPIHNNNMNNDDAFAKILADSNKKKMKPTQNATSVPRASTISISTSSSSSAPLSPPPSSPKAIAQPGELSIHLSDQGFDVRGNTFKYKDRLKEMGAKWNSQNKAWVFDTHDMLGLVRSLAGVDIVQTSQTNVTPKSSKTYNWDDNDDIDHDKVLLQW